MIARVLVLSALVLTAGCTPPDLEKSKSEIIAADKAFCAKAIAEGPRAAFAAYGASDVKLLSSFKQGAAAVDDEYKQFPATAKLEWDPSYVDVAASGDLGYTWGRYTLTVPSSKRGVPPLVRKGTYVTEWKKLRGAWKVVLDGGEADGEH